MHIETEQRKGLTLLHLAGDMSLSQTPELKSILLDALASCTELEVDLSQVGELDSAGLQLLLLLKRESLSRHKPMRLVAHSQAVVEVLETLHLAIYFGDPLVLSSA